MFNISSSHLSDRLKNIFVRFPVLLVVTTVTTVVSILSILEHIDSVLSMRILLTAFFVFPWTLLGALTAEKYKLNTRTNILIQCGVALFCSLYYFILPEISGSFEAPALIRVRLLGLVGFVLAFSYPFAKKEQQRLWQYWVTIVWGGVITLLFAMPLGIGLTLASSAVWQLFDIKFISIGKEIGIVWSIIMQIFAVWFFLSHVPKPHENPAYTKLTRILQILLYYILLPIVAIYFVILYAYAGKILFTWNWPDGGVAYWILGLSFIGMLTYAMSYGDIERFDAFKKKFFTAFFALLLPLVGVLFIAIGLRIQAYGLTIHRCLVIVGGVWLAMTAVYVLVRAKRPLPFMVYSGAFLVCFSLVGPWNVFRISLSNQVRHLERTLTEFGILVDEKIAAPQEPWQVSREAHDSIRSSIRYIVAQGGADRITPWFPQDFDTNQSSLLLSDTIFRSLSLSTDSAGVRDGRFDFASESSINFTTKVHDVRGYDYLFSDVRVVSGSYPRRVQAASDRSVFTFEMTNNRYLLIRQEEDDLISVDLLPEVNHLLETYGVNPAANEKDLIVLADNDLVRVKVVLSAISGTDEGQERQIEHMFGAVLLSFK